MNSQLCDHWGPGSMLSAASWFLDVDGHLIGNYVNLHRAWVLAILFQPSTEVLDTNHSANVHLRTNPIINTDNATNSNQSPLAFQAVVICAAYAMFCNLLSHQ